MSAEMLTDAQRQALSTWLKAGDHIVFTNGVFDLLHRGHVEYLEEARTFGERLVVGINSDASVRRIKGSERPWVPEGERAEILAALASVDLVVIFDEDTPERLIERIKPQVLVKGGDWALDQIVGRDFVEASGGRVERIAMRQGSSTTNLIERIRAGKSALDP